jgi:hypothetical protein
MGRYRPPQNCSQQGGSACTFNRSRLRGGHRQVPEGHFSGFIDFRKTETVADKGSCFGWAKYQGRNFCTAESILGFSRPVKYGLKRCPKLPKNGSRPARRSSETLIYKQIAASVGPKKGVQKSSENRCECDLPVSVISL